MDTPDDMQSLLYGDEPTSQEQARAMAAALRRQSFGARNTANQMSGVGALLSSTATPSLEQAGKAFGGYGKDQMDNQGALLRQLLEGQSYQKGQEDLSDTERRRSALGDPSSQLSQMRRGILGQVGFPVADNASTQDITDNEIGLLERMQAAKERRDSVLGAARTRNQPGGLGPEDPASLDTEANHFAKTGGFLLPGRNREALMHNRAVMARALVLHPDIDPATAAAAYKADSHSLTQSVGASDSMDRNEAKAEADLGVLEGTIAKMRTTGSPLLNTPLQSLLKNSGDPDIAAFLTARQAAISQVSRTLSANPNQVTEGIRREAEDLIHANYSPEQFASSFGILRQDMARNKMALHQSNDAIKSRISGKPVPQGSVTTTSPAAGGKPDIRARIAQLGAAGTSPADIKKALAAEYTAEEIKAARSR